MLKLLITFLLIIVARYGHSQENAYFYANNGEKISVVLPNGYCDINKTDVGKYLISHLNNTIRKTSGLEKLKAEAMVVFSKCNKSFGYPWGYIMFSHVKLDSTVTQLDLNKYESKSFNKNFAGKIKKRVNKSHELNQMEINIDALSIPEVVWDDENALITFSKINGMVEGEKMIEEFTGSIILHKNYRVYMYIYEEDGKGKGLENAYLLLEAAKKTKNIY